MTRALALVGVAVAALVLVAPAEAAAPRFILVSGDGLSKPVLLADWTENFRFLESLVGARRAGGVTVRGLTARRRLRLSLFWGVPASPRPTRPSDAGQTGWLYPAVGSEPAVIELLPRDVQAPLIVPRRALRILDRHGVPTRTTVPRARGEHPKLCTPAEVRILVQHVVAAFDAGNVAVLDELFAREPGYRWHSTTAPDARLRARAANRPSLVPYFAHRYRLGEQLRLRSLRVNGNTAAGPPYGNFAFTLTRSADDLEPTRYQGKGAVYCFRTRPDVVFVWFMAPSRASP